MFGIQNTTYIDLPANVDRAYIEGLRTAAGVDFPRVLTEIDARLTTFNGGLDPLLAQLIFTTDEAMFEGIQPIAFDVQEAGEYTIARPQFVEGAGHMLPLRKWDVSTAWTEDGLNEMSLNRILAQLDSILLGLKVRARREIFRRLFSDAEVRVDKRSTAVSPGFAGSGTGLNVFNRPLPDGSALPAGYTHYHRDTAANLGVMVKTMRNKLRNWGDGPFDLIAPQAQIDAIAALPDFVGAGSALIRSAPDQAEAQVDPLTYIGVYDKDIRVRKAITDFADPNICVFRTAGPLSPNNPLAWRFDSRAGRGRDAYLRSRQFYPLAQAEVVQRFGIGVAERTAAALGRVGDSGGYVAPTIP